MRRCADRLSFTISIHVPREGDDRRALALGSRGVLHFYPRPPRGGRQEHATALSYPMEISIHVPREGDDQPVRCI